MIEWSKVERKHVEEACRLYDAGALPPAPAAKSTFLIWKEQRYPAKFIRGEAYRLATGRTLKRTEYSGGLETARHLENLGFIVCHEPR
jgi:hypothetical protein